MSQGYEYTTEAIPPPQLGACASAYAQEGWRVLSVTPLPMKHSPVAVEEFVGLLVLFERPRPAGSALPAAARNGAGVAIVAG